GHEADDRDLLQHKREVEGVQEAAARDDAEEDDAQQKDDRGNRRRVDVEKVLQSPQECDFVFIEGRNLGIALLRHLLVVGHRWRGWLCARGHSVLPREKGCRYVSGSREGGSAGASSLVRFNEGSKRSFGASSPALAESVGRRRRRQTVDRLVGDELDARVEEVQPRSRLRLL